MSQATEQKTEFVEAITELVVASKTETPMKSEPNMNFWPLLLIAVIPVISGVLLTRWLNKRKNKK